MTHPSDEFIDYSNLLTDIERATKRLEDACLHKKYDGYLADVVLINTRLSQLTKWIAEQRIKHEPSSV